MKNIQDFIFRLKDLGINITLKNDDLKISAPKNVLTSDIIDDIKSLKLDIIEFFKKSTSEGVYESYTLLKQATIKDYYLLSSAQRRQYILQQMNLDSIAYNISHTIKLGNDIKKNKVEEVFHQLIARHESFRTSFEVRDEIPVQCVHEKVEFKIEEFLIEKSEVENTQNEFIRVFDLSKAPLLRVAIVEIEDENSLLMIDMHHIISDGVSLDILQQEFQSLYLGKELSPLSLQYKDYSEWQNSLEQQENIKKQEDYWLKKFSDEIPVVNLPLDYSRPQIQSYEGATVNFVLSKKETEDLKLMVKENGLTLYMGILSVYTILLSKLSAQEDIVVGSPIVGRNHADLENIVGMFVNTLCIRNEVRGEETIKEFISGLKQTTLESFENQDFQFEDLVDKISVERDTSRNPIFDVAINLLNQAEYSRDISGINSENLIHIKGVSKFDLTLIAIDYDDQLLLSFEYCTKLFKSETIDRFITYFKQIVNQLPNKLDEKLSRLEIISAEERQQLLYDFNNTKVDYSKGKTISQLFEEQVERTPDNIAIVYGFESITYLELNKQANQFARYLINSGDANQEIIGVLHEYSLDVYIGILAVLKIGKAYLPIDSSLPDARIQFMLKDSCVKTIITSNQEDRNINNFADQIVLINTDIINEFEPVNLNLNIPRTSPVYVIYTSGSTGVPKGIVVDNRALVNLCFSHNSYYGVSYHDRVIKYAGFGFDASIWEIFPGLIVGSSLYIIEERIKYDEDKVNEYFNSRNITISFLPTQFCERFMNCKNKSLRILLTGGDKLKYYRKNEYKLYNNYGPTENTVVSTRFQVDNIEDNIPIGKPLENIQVYILDKINKLQPIGVPGELCISGEGLALGYLNNPELTVEKFIDHPFKEGEKLYRTGDLARWLPDGNIEFLGRIDHQVKIRGFRIELGEIENALLKHENIKESIVLAREEQGDKYLCAYVVSDGTFNPEAYRTFLSASLPDYMIPSYFVEMDSLPLTSNGKINRKALPLPEVKAGDDYVAPSNPIEEQLVKIWGQVLNIPEEEISVSANFFAIGGHSLKASSLTGKIHKALGIEFPLRDVFLHSTIKAQAQQVGKSGKKAFISIPKAKDQDYYALSSAQKRLYLLQQMDNNSTVYNMPYVIPLGEEVDKEKVEEVFRQLISRHESFRTSFVLQGEEPVQYVHESIEFEVSEFKVDKSEAIRDTFIEAFDLSQAPLLRVGIVDIKGEGSLLMIDMHHIISDGVSHEILKQDFQRLYSGEELPPLLLQYKDYSEWQNSKEQQEKKKEQEEYWLNKFAGETPVLDLPMDYVRPAIQSFDGASVNFVLNREETQNIKSLAKENGLTLYMSVLSVFSILLSKLSGQEDIVIGTPIAGRNHVDLGNVVGMFVNTLAIRNEISRGDTLGNYARKIKQTTLEAFENQDYQFEDLVEKVSVERDTSRHPLFDVMFNMLNQGNYEGDLSTFNNNELVHTPSISMFDLILTGVDYGEQLMFSFEYSTKLFKAETIERFISYFLKAIRQLPEKIDEKLSSLDLLSSKERFRLLYQFNDTKQDYPKDKTIHELFEEQVAKAPDNIAIVKDDISLSYNKLNVKANQLANGLFKKGFSLGNKIGVLVDRSVESIITILGVLKAGCVYLPLEKESPQARLNYIIKDSDLNCILDPTPVKDNKTELIPPISIYQEMLNTNEIELRGSMDKESPAYIIYTSGTTGNPKGVLVGHQSLTNLITSQIVYYQLNTTERILQFSSLNFDASLEQIGISLLSGGQLVLIEKEKLLNLEEFYKYIAKTDITHLDVVPTFLNELEADKCSSLKRLIVGGEVCERRLVEKWSDKLLFYNAYGPTETTVTSIELKIGKGSKELDKLSIGKPLVNTEVYILNKSNKLQPLGIPGELCISGEGLALGYLNNPELTTEKFIPHPFKEGERLYRTGDLARWLPDGNIEFLGRIDHQVKIRGFRIELGEIENALLKHENIKEGAVVAREENGDKYLCAYIVFEGDFNEEKLRNHLSTQLPDYMIPSYFVELEELPLTSNGKVNRKALPAPEVKAGDDHVAPRNETEEKFVEIWSEVLNIPQEEISVTANFFSIGGHSLKASACINRFRNKFDINIPLIEIFKNPTIIQLAYFVEVNKLKTGIADDHLILLKEGAVNGENIFLIHDGSGEVDGYIEFCKQANDGINYWGIRAGNLKNHEPVNFTIEQLTNRYIKCIKKVQKHGEYNIAGWSLGGTIAFEMARQLEQENDKVRFLGIIDSYAPVTTKSGNLNEFTVESELSWIRKYFDDNEVISRFSSQRGLKYLWFDIIDYLKNIEGASEIIKGEIVKNIGFDIKEYKKVSIEELVKFMNFTRSLNRACNNYVPRNTINTQINYFAACESKNIIIENWHQFSKKVMNIKEVEGNHFSIFTLPHVKSFYNQFNECFVHVDKKILFEAN